MIKIKKLYIENFKGINSVVKIDFSNNDEKVIVLSGANGFGKTTIFEAIELCLTGIFHRIEVFDHVQKKTSNKIKPFYQNTNGKDVTIKLLVQNDETNEEFIIIKHFDDDNSPRNANQRRENIPIDSCNFFNTYLSMDTTSFDNNDPSSYKEIDQSRIDKLFYGEDSTIELNSTYYLFNYLQQEDSIYFLKQDEDEKGKKLSFLFNIENEERKRNKVSSLCVELGKKFKSIEAKIESINETISNSEEEVSYKRLFDESKFEFDKEDPFENITDKAEKLNQFNEEFSTLIDFREKFSLIEYEKSIHFNRINKDIIDSKELLQELVLKKVYSKELVEKIDLENIKIEKTAVFIDREDKTKIEKEFFDWFTPDESEEYKNYLALQEKIKEIDKDLGEVGKIVSELIVSRDKSINEFEKLHPIKVLSEDNCPLCDSPFASYHELINEITKKTKQLEAYNKSKLDSKKQVFEKISVIAKLIEKEANKFLKENKLIEKIVISKLRAFPNFENRLNKIIELYPEIDSAASKDFFFTTIPEIETVIQEKAEAIKNFISYNLIPKYSYDEGLIPNKECYSKYFDNKPDLFNKCTVDVLKNKLEFIKKSYNANVNKKLQFLKARLEKLEKIKAISDDILKSVNETIKSHKSEMIGQIKIPFYIYSGKILQSYQQGMGIFVDIRETGQNNKVWFKTGHSSDHDIVYHLSSGQMAVVSIAFCLSLNKVYNTNEHFKFLAIDDPIQTMDDLNVHTFIELLRYDFSNYQLIMSTHDDFTSRYIKYKFDKLGFNTGIKNVQHLILEESIN